MFAHDTLVSLWDHNGADQDGILFEFPDGETISYGMTFELADKFAAIFMRCGVRPGDRIASVVDKSHHAIILYIACVRFGAVYCPINATSTLREISYLIEHSKPSLIVSRSESVNALRAVAPQIPIETLDADGSGTIFDRIENGAAHGAGGHMPRAKDPVSIMYTSGTTGQPKAALMSHWNLASNAAALKEAWQFHRNDVLMHALPIHHTHGLFVAMNVVLAAGARVLFLPRFDAAAVTEALPFCTVMMGVPTFYTRLLNYTEFQREATRNIRLFISGSAPLPLTAHAEFERRTGHRIMERYGMTEVGIITSNVLSEPPVSGTVGVPLKGVEVRLVPTSEPDVSRVEVRGPGVFEGYWSPDGCNRSDFTDDGYFVTGDLGTMDRNGHLTLVGREKDMVITGGLNVYPKEVEQQIRLIEGIEEAAVVGVPHSDFGEAVVAFVVMRAASRFDEPDIKAALRESLAGYKQPKRVLVLAELPRNTMGKVDSKALRRQFAEMFPSSERSRQVSA